MENQTLEIIVPKDKQKERLDLFLCSHLPSITRAKLKRLVDEDLVLVNGKATKADQIVRPNEIITVQFPPQQPSHLEAEDIPLDIVYEDEFLLVVNKPAGLVVHPAYGNMSGTLVNALLAHCNALSDVGGAKRPGLVHRLDKDTSGLLVVAKDDVTHVALARQLSAHKIEREYRAIVWWHFKEQEGRVEAALGRHPRDRVKMCIDVNGKHAITNYQVLEEMNFTSYVKLNLETGRTHQIRVHMKHLGHPVFSDSTYGGRGKPMGGQSNARAQFVNRLLKKFTRQMLHARILTFKHPTSGELLTFEAAIPPDMRDLLNILRTSDV